MLQFLRGHASSWVMKIVLGLIVLSFCVFGITSLFIGKGQQVLVAKVGKVEISKQYLLHEVQRRLQAANRELKDISLTLEQAVKMGLPKKILDDLVRKILVEQELKDLNIAVSEGTLSSMVFADPSFKNEQGRFDGEKFKKVLANNGLNEASFMARRAKQLVEAQFMSGISAASKPSGSMTLRLFNDLFEERALTLYTVDEDSLKKSNPKIQKMEKSQLMAYYDAHAEDYKTPEKRKFATLIIDPKRLEKKFKFSAAEIKASYEQQLDNYAVPEKRDIQVFTDKDWRKVKMVNKLFDQKKTPPKGTVTTLYNVSQAELSDKLGEEAFEMKAGEFSDVFRAEEGFQVVKVLKVTPATTQPLKKVKAQVIADLKRQKAMDEMATLIQTIEDAISGGASLEEVAKEHHLQMAHTTPLAADAKSFPKGVQEHMLKTSFEQEIDETGPVVELEDGMAYVVRVDQVDASILPPFDSVQNDVRTHLLQERMKEAVEKKVESLVNKGAMSAKHIKKLQKDPTVQSVKLPPMNFTGSKDHPDVKNDIRGEAWKLDKGHAARVTYRDQPAVVYVDSIKPAVVEQSLGDYTNLKHEMAEMLNRDLLLQYFNALKEKHNVVVYEDILANIAE